MRNSSSDARRDTDRMARLIPVLVVLGFGLAAPAFAVDGVIEINQARALAGNVTPGDFAGFPVSITQAGSYRLTSDLTAPAGFDGIDISADNVSLDLNGFHVIGGGGSISDGISLVGSQNVEIRNGTVRGFSRHGVFTNSFAKFIRVVRVTSIGNTFSGFEIEGVGSLVDGCTAGTNGTGIRVVEGSLVINSVARANTGLGLVSGATSGYRSNVLTGNNGSDANGQTSSTGLQLGANVCGTRVTCP